MLTVTAGIRPISAADSTEETVEQAQEISARAASYEEAVAELDQQRPEGWRTIYLRVDRGGDDTDT